jgi:hypothetical protein
MAHPQPHKVIFVLFFGQIPREMIPHGFLLAIFPPLTSQIPKKMQKRVRKDVKNLSNLLIIDQTYIHFR